MSSRENAANTTPRPRKFPKGIKASKSVGSVYYRKDREVWRVRKWFGGTRVSLGCFQTREEAVAALRTDLDAGGPV